VGLLVSSVHPKGVDESLISDGENMVTKLMIQGKSTSGKIDELFSIYHLLLTKANLDSPAKAIELLKESRSRLESRIQGSGHSFANTRLASRYRVSGLVDEMMRGISYLDTVKALIKQAEEDWPTLLARLEKMRETMLDDAACRSGMVLDITGDQSVLSTIESSVSKFLESLPGSPIGAKPIDFYTDPHPWVPAAKKRLAGDDAIQDEGFVVPTQVSYVGKAGLLYEPGERVSGAASVVARFLRTGYLWDRVRVMGGAYGGFCVFAPDSGVITFLSYRDPNLEKTLDVYDAAADAVLAAADALENDSDALTTAIIGAIGDMDGALSPDQKGYTAFQQWIVNESSEYRQRFRDEVLNTKPSDFREFAERLRRLKSASVAVISSKGAFESASKAGKVMTLKEVI
jgi:presequence protease